MNLIFSSIYLVDLTNKEAKKVYFESGKNLITSSHNHLGKSVIMKSLYYTLGADVYFPLPIKRIKYLTIVDFALENNFYRVARLSNSFVLYGNNTFIGMYPSVNAFEDKLCELFNLEICLVSKDTDGTIVKCPPAYYFLPYYVDQENGWSPNSYSFDRMTQFDLPQRKSSFFFHLGVLDKDYVLVSKRQKENDKQIAILSKDNEKFKTVVETLQAGQNDVQMSFDIDALEKAIRRRKSEIQGILEAMSKTRKKVIQAEDEKIHLEHEKEIISKLIKKAVPLSGEVDNQLNECPRCGLMFRDTIVRRLQHKYLNESLQEDYSTIADGIINLEKRIIKMNKEYYEKQNSLKRIEENIDSDKKTYDVYIRSKATKQLIEDYYNQIAKNTLTIEELQADNSDCKQKLGAYKQERDDVNQKYKHHFNSIIGKLDIPLDQIDADRELGASINASGAYGPRCKIAQILSFVETKQAEAPDLVSFPIVIDSPNVLEQDSDHLDSVIRTLFTWNNTPNQIIVSSIQGKEIAEELGDVNIIVLNNPQNHLLSAEEYNTFRSEIDDIFTHF